MVWGKMIFVRMPALYLLWIFMLKGREMFHSTKIRYFRLKEMNGYFIKVQNQTLV